MNVDDRILPNKILEFAKNNPVYLTGFIDGLFNLSFRNQHSGNDNYELGFDHGVEAINHFMANVTEQAKTQLRNEYAVLSPAFGAGFYDAVCQVPSRTANLAPGAAASYLNGYSSGQSRVRQLITQEAGHLAAYNMGVHDGQKEATETLAIQAAPPVNPPDIDPLYAFGYIQGSHGMDLSPAHDQDQNYCLGHRDGAIHRGELIEMGARQVVLKSDKSPGDSREFLLGHYDGVTFSKAVKELQSDPRYSEGYKGGVDVRTRWANNAKTALDVVYGERSHFIYFLTSVYESHTAVATDAEPGFQYVVCVHTPSGQLSWHVSDDHYRIFFSHLPIKHNDWDQHTNDEKYRRLEDLANNLADLKTKIDHHPPTLEDAVSLALEIRETLKLLYTTLNKQAIAAIGMKRQPKLAERTRDHAQGRADALRVPLAHLRTYPAVYDWLCETVGDFTDEWVELETTTKYKPERGNE